MIDRDGDRVGGDGVGDALREYIDAGNRDRAKHKHTREAIERELLKLGAKPEDLLKSIAVFTESQIFGMPAGYVVGAEPVEALEAWQAGAVRFPLELKNRKPPEFVLAYLRKYSREPLERGDVAREPKRASSDTFVTGSADPTRDEAEQARAARQQQAKGNGSR